MTSAPPACRVRTRLAVSAVTCRQADIRSPRERFFLGEAIADAGQDRHVLVGPENAFLPAHGEFEVLHIGKRGVRHRGFLSYENGSDPCNGSSQMRVF